MKQKNRIEVSPVQTLGDLIDLLKKACAVVDCNMTHQNQRETPVKVEVTFSGRIKAVILTELDPERFGSLKGYGEAGVDDFGPEEGGASL